MRENPSVAFLIVAAAAAVTVFAYAGTLTGPFVFDDEHNILHNPHLRIETLSPQALYAAAFQSPIPTRPVANVSFALNYMLSGYNVVGYRLVNVLVHVLNGFLVFALATVTLRLAGGLRDARRAPMIAAAAAALWMLHPLHTQSVAYIVQRMTSLATLFFLLSLVCYAHARLCPSPRRRSWLIAACVVAGLLAFGTKQIAATLPPCIFLYEWFFFRGADPGWLRRNPGWLAAAAAATGVLGLAYMRTTDPVAYVLQPYAADGSVTAAQRLFTQFRVVCLYIGLLLWPSPSRLNLDHSFSFSRSLVDPPATLLALGLIVGLLAAAVVLARRERLAAYAVLWFFGNLVIESSFIRLETIFEHRTYLPSVMPAIALAGWALGRLRLRWAAVALPVALAILWSAWSWQRCLVWGDAVTLWQDCIAKSPGKARPYNNLGATYMRLGRLPEAIPPLETAVTIAPGYADAWYNLGYALMRAGELDAGITATERLLELEPENVMAWNNLGIAYLLRGDYAASVQRLRKTVSLKPDYETAWNNLGVALRNAGELESARESFARAVELRPDYAEASNNLGLTLKEMGDLEGAAEAFERALRIDPDYEAAARNLEAVLASGAR
jgi:tetratricopeptide (TPR) repeat protein